MSQKTQNTNRHREQPTYWFAALEIARERNDFERAAEAQRELRRLGVSVNYDHPPVRPRNIIVK